MQELWLYYVVIQQAFKEPPPRVARVCQHTLCHPYRAFQLDDWPLWLRFNANGREGPAGPLLQGQPPTGWMSLVLLFNLKPARF